MVDFFVAIGANKHTCGCLSANFHIAKRRTILLECFPHCGPVAQLVRAGDSSRKVRLHRKMQSERDEFRETLAVRLMAILSQASGTPLEGAETTWELQCS